jgi:hypothetical protein
MSFLSVDFQIAEPGFEPVMANPMDGKTVHGCFPGPLNFFKWKSIGNQFLRAWS